MVDYLYLGLYYIFRAIAIYTPQNLQRPFLNALAKLFYKFDKKHTNIMRINLKMCKFDNIEEIILNTYRNFAYFGMEFLRNQNSTKEQILAKVDFKNEKILDKFKDRPIIITTAHYGNWELFSLAMAAKFGPVSIVGRNLDSPVMDKILSKNRSQFNIKVIPKSGGAKMIIKALQKRRLLGILVDQNIDIKDGLECEFFSNKIAHTHAASIFASKLNAVIIPAFIQRVGSKNLISFYDPIDINLINGDKIKIATQLQSDATQMVISSKPDEYFWMHKKFKHFYPEIYK
ncbi:lipid A biosynthesis lauroyl acyltransferase [Campylobacter porcelli]|uniref:Lipid A biosynthesis lauroyl acyltransferase n=1 Tax=Campylobacter porcelli TaxID=1660073 RepID=A0A1X9SXN6_9BACT|nr:lipid A biosynthesis lauroyl acyltransferase [Campylobacter sp. RM6137]ARR01020.1 lipid A biosynthesis lauroyl acyltransferase [Campylobacter sp. RM6137]